MNSQQKIQRITEWLQETSFREVTLLADLLVTGWIFYLYLTRLAQASMKQLASMDWIAGVLLEIIIYSIILSVISRILLAIVSTDELSQPLDVREKQISLVGYKYTAWILQIGVIFAIVQYNIQASGYGFFADLTLPHMPLHILLSAFLLSELTHYGVQLYKGRTGNIYE